MTAKRLTWAQALIIAVLVLGIEFVALVIALLGGW